MSVLERERRRLWADMLARSFDPREWYALDDAIVVREDTIMWVYRRTEQNLWTVGYFSPQKEWVTDSDHSSREQAAQRVHWLNGGGAKEVG
jgi:hypothetical protein